HNDEYQYERLDQRAVHGRDRLVDEHGRVVDDAVIDAGRESLLQLDHPRPQGLGGREGVGPGPLEDGDADGRTAVEEAVHVVIAGPALDPGDVLEPGHLAGAAGLDDHVAELVGVDQPAAGLDGVLEVEPG